MSSPPPPSSPVTPVAAPPPESPPVTPPPVTPVTPPPVTPVTPPPVTPVTPPPVIPVTPPPVTPVTPPPVIPVTPPPVTPVTPPPATPVTPPPVTPVTPPVTPPVTTPPVVPPVTQPPVPGPAPVTPVTPPPPPPPKPTPTPNPTPVTPSPPPPRPTPTPTPTPGTPSPPPPRSTPTPTPVTPSPPPPTPVTSPPPSIANPSPPPTSGDTPPSPNDVPASTPPPPSDVSLSPPPPAPQLASAPSTSTSSKSSGTGIVVGVAVGAVALLGLAAVLICFFVSRRRRRRGRLPPPGTPADFFYDPRQTTAPLQQPHAMSTTPSSTPPLMHSWQSSSGGGPPGSPLPAMTGGTFAYDELAAAADGFSEANLLGQGGFGQVYKGTVRGQEVAIKKLAAGSGQGHREFRAEVDIISRVHHKNLVSLVGFCIHGEQRLLVYEYIPNKTLEAHLHHGSGRPTTLDWPRRWKIAVGSAKGLAYLHEDCHPKIIHRDIKAANILLDYNYEAKVADFGLAKFQETEHTAVSTRVMGTFGYLAPEYAATGKVNDRSDVFSFGVMLLELVTGRKPVMISKDNQPDTLVSWARPLLQKAVEEENYEELIDPKLESNYDAYDMARLVACAAAAVRQTARSRPRMTQIVRYLEGELSAEDLNAGLAPGQSAMQQSTRGGNTDEVRRLRKMAFGPGTGTISEYASSELSGQTSEYGLYPSSEYTASSGADTGEMTDAPRRTGMSVAEWGGDEEKLSRRTAGSRQGPRRGTRG